MFSVMRTFSKFKPFEIRHADGKRGKFDSLVLANIAQMAKYATLSEADDAASDGQFEVVIFPHRSKLRVLLTALRAATQGQRQQLPVHDPQAHPVSGRRRSEIRRSKYRGHHRMCGGCTRGVRVTAEESTGSLS
jgi:hypothetical protein